MTLFRPAVIGASVGIVTGGAETRSSALRTTDTNTHRVRQPADHFSIIHEHIIHQKSSLIHPPDALIAFRSDSEGDEEMRECEPCFVERSVNTKLSSHNKQTSHENASALKTPNVCKIYHSQQTANVLAASRKLTRSVTLIERSANVSTKTLLLHR